MRSARRSLTPLQAGALIGSFLILFWSVPGLFVNPDFSVGDAATSERVLGADMNGWHAVSGFLVAIPCLAALRHPRALAIVMTASAGGLIATAVWAMFSTRIAGGLFFFPNNEVDAILHLVVTAAFVWGLALSRRGRRPGADAPA